MSRFDLESKLSPQIIAKETLRDCDINEFPVDLKMVNTKLGIYFQEDRLNIGEEGCAFKNDGKYGILINNTIKNNERKKFTIAHEIGHIQLKHLKDIKKISCFSEDIENYKTNKLKEAEANEFASELILPSDEIVKLIKKNNINFNLIEKASDFYGSSFTAAAVKIAKLSDLPCILVMSKDKKVEWSIASQDLKFKYNVPRGYLSDITLAMELFNNENMMKLEDEIEAIEWLDDGDNSVDELDYIKEHSVYYPNYNRVLTLLVFPDIAY